MSWKLPSDMPRESGTTKKTGEFRGFGLPARLQAVASCVGIGARIVDVGTDHGLLPIALVGSGRASKAIAADLRPQPLDMARQNVQRFGKNEEIELRLGDGLKVLEPFEADTVTIAGMSGRRMVEILRAVNLEELELDRLILQPNSDQMEMRQALTADGWSIVYERLVTCGARCYVVVVFERGQTVVELSRTDALLGPYLKQDPTNQLYQIWCRMMAELLQTKVTGLRKGGANPQDLALAESDLATFSQIID